MVLLVPGNWLLAALAAACIHEAGHILALVLLGGRVRSVRLGAFGAVIEGEGVSGAGAALCTLAGPLCSFLTVLLARTFPLLALCGLLQAIYNLLPVYPADGGRILCCLSNLLLPGRITDTLTQAVQWGTVCLVLLLGGYAAFVLHLGLLPLLAGIAMALGALKRK